MPCCVHTVNDIMPTETTFIQRSKEKLTKHRAKATAGVATATVLGICYPIFVTQSAFTERMRVEKEARSAQWRLLQDQDNRLDALDKQLEIHKAVHEVLDRIHYVTNQVDFPSR